MANEILLSQEALDFAQRAKKIDEERKKNPNISPGILVEAIKLFCPDLTLRRIISR